MVGRDNIYLEIAPNFALKEHYSPAAHRSLNQVLTNIGEIRKWFWFHGNLFGSGIKMMVKKIFPPSRPKFGWYKTLPWY